MADNSTRLNATGVSETLASDDIGGVKYQRVKINVGPDGQANDVILVADGASAQSVLPSAPMLYNGTTVDPMRANTEGTLLALGARTIVTASATQTNNNSRGVILTLSATVAGTGTMTVEVQTKDADGNWLSFITFTPVTTTGWKRYDIGPGVTEVAGARLGMLLPRTWRANVSKSDGSSWTYSLGYSLTN